MEILMEIFGIAFASKAFSFKSNEMELEIRVLSWYYVDMAEMTYYQF